MPTLLATPWPSGPVVVSTPVVMRYSGWPGVLLPSCRKFLMSSIETAGVDSILPSGFTALHACQMDQRIEQHRGVAVGEHKAVAIGPDADLRDRSAGTAATGSRRPGASAIGAPGWPELAFWTASIESVRIVLMTELVELCTGGDRLVTDCHRFLSSPIGGNMPLTSLDEIGAK